MQRDTDTTNTVLFTQWHKRRALDKGAARPATAGAARDAQSHRAHRLAQSSMRQR